MSSRYAQPRLIKENQPENGFTLIELSIVLVIIGLIVGGILTGQDLIRAATVRATITQIEKYNTATNAFRDKFGYLPGDIPAAPASQFGFVSRGSLAGQGDGNGLIEGWNGSINSGFVEGMGETIMFRVDLTTARLIDGSFTVGSPSSYVTATVTATTTPSLAAYFPPAKIGRGNYMYVASYSGQNYFFFSAISLLGSPGGCAACIASAPALTVQEAKNLDQKIDDGMPLSGNVIAAYVNEYLTYDGTNGTTATSGSSSTCYDNANVTGATQQYSLAQNAGNGVNCALSFRFQ